MACNAQYSPVTDHGTSVDMSHILPGHGAQKHQGKWGSTVLKAIVVLTCGTGILYGQNRREDALWTRLDDFEGNMSRLVSNKHTALKLNKLLTAREVQLQQFWKDLGDQMQRSQQVRKDFQKEVKKDTEFQTHLTGILNSVSTGIRELRQQAVPGKQVSEENWEKEHFPEIWKSLKGLEKKANRAVGDPTLMKKLHDEVSWLTEQLSYAKQDVAVLQRKDDFYKVQHQLGLEQTPASAWSLAEANSSSTRIDAGITKEDKGSMPQVQGPVTGGVNSEGAKSSFLDKSSK